MSSYYNPIRAEDQDRLPSKWCCAATGCIFLQPPDNLYLCAISNCTIAQGKDERTRRNNTKEDFYLDQTARRVYILLVLIKNVLNDSVEETAVPISCLENHKHYLTGHEVHGYLIEWISTSSRALMSIPISECIITGVHMQCDARWVHNMYNVLPWSAETQGCLLFVSSTH